MSKKSIKIFWEKCSVIREEYDKVYSASEIEVLLVDFLEFIKDHSKDQAELEDCFVDLISDRARGPYEIVVFCMRELQWPKVKEAVIERIEKTDDPRIHSCMNDILAVYAEEWEDSDMYEYYSGESREDGQLNQAEWVAPNSKLKGVVDGHRESDIAKGAIVDGKYVKNPTAQNLTDVLTPGYRILGQSPFEE